MNFVLIFIYLFIKFNNFVVNINLKSINSSENNKLENQGSNISSLNISEKFRFIVFFNVA
jgi:hypothetical protein